MWTLYRTDGKRLYESRKATTEREAVEEAIRRGVRDFREAELHDLEDVYFPRTADLRYADLSYANLRNATLYGVNLRGARLPSPGMVLLAFWGKLSAKTTTALMRLDATGHPYPSAFDHWAETGVCPYGVVGFGRQPTVARVANFLQNASLWEAGPAPTLWEAMCMVLDEKCPTWRQQPRKTKKRARRTS